ncbi:Diphthamide biosynthesis protein 3 [Paramyrothecium foliicola]|nr:Diphthamide biosynthesis protein 3 [Paramyrothecium foliicola]
MSGDDELAIYDEIEFEDLTWDEGLQVYSYPCPCGDRFQITLDDLRDEQDIAVCPSCSLMIRVIYDLVSKSASFAPPFTRPFDLYSLFLSPPVG